MSDLFTWCADYADTLPPAIRPSTDDPRFVAAARRARDNGWQPGHIARLVAGQSYAKAYNPPLIALMQLERIGERAPHRQAQPGRNVNGCVICPPGHRCPDPALPEHRLPGQWVRERIALLRELQHTPDLSEDEREEAMTILIRHQKARPA